MVTGRRDGQIEIVARLVLINPRAGEDEVKIKPPVSCFFVEVWERDSPQVLQIGAQAGKPARQRGETFRYGSL